MERYSNLSLKCFSKLQLFSAIAIDLNSPLCAKSEKKSAFCITLVFTFYISFTRYYPSSNYSSDTWKSLGQQMKVCRDRVLSSIEYRSLAAWHDTSLQTRPHFNNHFFSSTHPNRLRSVLTYPSGCDSCKLTRGHSPLYLARYRRARRCLRLS